MRFFYRFLSVVSLVFAQQFAAVGQVLDPGFAPSTLAQQARGVQLLLKQPDGKIIISGSFNLMNGQASPRVARLNADGSPDLAFRAQAGMGPTNLFISALGLQPDGKIILGAENGSPYAMYDGVAVQQLFRLNADGSLDGSFSAGGAGWSGREIRTIAVQANGNILVGGGTTATYNGQPTNGLVRLLPTGQPDASFAIGTGFTFMGGPGEIRKVVVQPDGNLAVTGLFTAFAGQPRQSVARLTPAGGLDASFTSPLGASAFGFDLVRQPDGKLLVGGRTLTGTGAAGAGAVRLLADGTPDPGFTALPSTGQVTSLALRSDGSVLVAGSSLAPSNSAPNNLVRLTSAGTVDATFTPGAIAPLEGVAVLNNGQYLVAGYYNLIAGRYGLVRLLANGLTDASYAMSLQVVTGGSLTPLNNGQVLLNASITSFNGVPVSFARSNLIHRINANGTYNALVTFPPPNTRNGTDFYVDIVPHPDGTFYSAYQNTDTTMQVRRILSNGAFDPLLLSVELQFGTSRTFPLCCGGTVVGPAPNAGLLVLGAFERVDGQPRPYIARLLANGSLDAGFAPTAPAPWQQRPAFIGSPAGFRGAYSLPNGKTLVTWNDIVRSYLIRLNADGSLDNTFSVGTAGGPTTLFTIFPLASGQVLVKGNFTAFNGQAAPNGLVRLLPTGAPDPAFAAASAAQSLAEQPDGKLVVVAPGSTYQQNLLRLRLDGSLDAGFQPVAIVTPSFGYAQVYLQPGTNAILLSGDFTSVAGQPRFGLARLVNTPLAARSPVALPAAEVFPNPAHDYLTVRLAAPGTGALTLTDLQGRLVRRWTPAQAVSGVSVAGLTPGLYVLCIPLATGPRWQRVAVE